MCGITGYIGNSKKPKLTFELATKLFDNLELRGTDAAGVWGVESGGSNRVIYHKEPIRSSKFVEKSFWKNVAKLRPDILLLHARAASSGVGEPRINSNNHPFVSDDKTVGLVHNGFIAEYKHLKEKYETRWQTDSEILLRMYEAGVESEELPEIDKFAMARLSGIRDIWSVVDEGAMAVAVGERLDDNTRYLFLFRNEQRPLWIADLCEPLGQIFFFSSPEIWYKAANSTSTLRKFCYENQKLIEVPPHQIWFFKIDESSPHATHANTTRYSVSYGGNSKDWTADEVQAVKHGLKAVDVVTQLDENDELIKPKSKKPEQTSERRELMVIGRPHDEYPDPFRFSRHGVGMAHEEHCRQIKELVADIQTNIENGIMEETLGAVEYQEIVDSLKNTMVDLQATLQILGGY